MSWRGFFFVCDYNSILHTLGRKMAVRAFRFPKVRVLRRFWRI